ncbi:acyl carrier protein [Peterkaempfera griseoplana]|uniref:acyl carrier protein n=1 Tax=Peterkaempfera griseoplana TaxID=66896 RepID=UPI0006E41E47|nr:acyl carrier protein [Peterkaempfera griseoplana]BCN13460.1 acyl carrier protein [Peterkaempfera griseoplana]
MGTTDITARIHGIISRMSPTGAAVGSPADRLVEDLGYDSVTFLELAVALEEEFDLTALDDDQATDLTTVAQVEALVIGTAEPSAPPA